MESYAVSLNVVLDWAGGVDFNASVYEVRTVGEFFEDRGFMKRFEESLGRHGGYSDQLPVLDVEDLEAIFRRLFEEDAFIREVLDVIPKDGFDRVMLIVSVSGT
jgi:hypothetical protein